MAQSFTAESSAAILAAALAWRLQMDAYDPLGDDCESAWDAAEMARSSYMTEALNAEIKDDDSGTTVAS